MKKRGLSLMIAVLLALPVAAFAGGGMDHGSMKMDAAMVMLPMQEVDGIYATVHLNDVKAEMAKMGMGMKRTHHFMVTLEDGNGEEVVPQVVAVKIVDPGGKEAAPVKLMSMAGHSGADVILATPGVYKFIVAAKLAGDKKVQYEFTYTLK